MSSPKKVKKPSLALRKKLKPLIDAATRMIILSPPTTKVYPQIVIKWQLKAVGGSKPDIPEGFLGGYVLGRDSTTVCIKYEARKVVNWFYEHGFINYNARDLYKSRMGIVADLTKMENDLMKLVDINQEFLYNDGIVNKG